MARVLIISLVCEPDTVSTGTITTGLANGLRHEGHDVTLLSSIPHYNPPAGFAARRRPFTTTHEGGVRVIRCFIPRKGGTPLVRVLHYAIFHTTVTTALLARCRRTDVAIVVSPPFTLAFVAFLLKSVSRTRVVYNAQELWPDVPRDLGVIRNPIVLGALARAESFIYRRADAITPIGERFGEAIAERGGSPDKIVVIPNFVDNRWISPRPKDNELAREWHVHDRPVVLYAGNLGLTQDFDLLFDAATKLPDVEFLIVGDGSGRAEVERLSRERGLANVSLHGFVSRERVADLYGLADVVAVPLRAGHDRTTTPSKIFSAMAAGKPVLACAAADTDLADTIQRSRAGVTVPPGDAPAFVEAVEGLTRGGHTSWDRENALKVASEHAPANVSRSYAELVDRLVSSSTAR